MNLNSLIINTLQPLNVPVDFLTYTGTTRPYITFLELDQRAALNSDDEESETSHFIQVDVFHSGNYHTLVDQVKQALKGVGFTRTSEYDFYETDTKLFHKVIRFSFTSTPV